MLTAAAVLAGLAVLLWPARSRMPRAGRARDPAGCPPSRVLDSLVRQLADHLPRRVGAGRSGAGEWVADFAEVVAVGLDAGLDLASAALASARSPTVAVRAPWLATGLEAALADGGGVTAALAPPDRASEVTERDLAVLVGAWRLSEVLGASAADVTRAAATTARSRRAARERTAAVVAGPRASMYLLTGLPLAGPIAGMLLGVGPASFYGSPAAVLSAVVGAALTAIGWWWGRALLRRSARAARTDVAAS